MILVNNGTVLDRVIERWQRIKKEAGTRHKSFPFNSGNNGLDIADTLRRLSDLKMANSFRYEELKDILERWVDPPITCDNCHKEAEAIVVFEETHVPNEGGPFGFCRTCLIKAAHLLPAPSIAVPAIVWVVEASRRHYVKELGWRPKFTYSRDAALVFKHEDQVERIVWLLKACGYQSMLELSSDEENVKGTIYWEQP